MSYTFITGAPRSGTSMTCQVLHACGLDFGNALGNGNKYNPHGYFEDLNVRHGPVKKWLRYLGADPAGQDPLPDRNRQPTEAEAREFRRDIDQVLHADTYKDPKWLLLWRFAHAAFPDARWIVVRRDRDAIARSCHRIRMMHCRDTLDGWREWVSVLEGWIEDLVDATDAVEVWPDPTEPECFREAVEFCGLTWNQGAVESVLHPESWGRVA